MLIASINVATIGATEKLSTNLARCEIRVVQNFQITEAAGGTLHDITRVTGSLLSTSPSKG